jgi:hypothetical protein
VSNPLPLKYHEGEISVQQRAGAFDASDLESSGLGGEFDARAASFLALQRWAVVAAMDREHLLWASLLHGKPGFLQVRDPRTLSVDASLPPDDPLAESFWEEAEIGMLVLDPRIRRRMRINGRALMQAGGQLHVTAREVYANCPKYIQRREVVREEEPRPSRPMESWTLSEAQRQWIERADTFFIGSVHEQAGMDCSHRGGNPGFVRVKDDRHVVFADYSGNNMFQTLGNLSLDSRAALLFLDFETGGTLQVSGRAKIIWDEALAREWAGAQRLVEVEVLKTLEAASAFPLRWRSLDYSPFNPGR